MKISNSFVIKLVVVTILFKIASECGAAEHCIPSSYKVNPDNIVTASGFTPEEALKKFHEQLPQIGILQTVNLKTKKTRKEDFFSQSTDISKSIHANFDYVTKFQCKKGLNYVISGIVPKETIDYIPKDYAELRYYKNQISKFLTFKKAKDICGNESYHLITSNHTIDFTEYGDKSFYIRRIEGSRFSYNEKIGFARIMVVCGFNWKIHYNKLHNFKPNLIKNTWTHIVSKRNQGIFKRYDKYMHLQMISNAIKGE